VKERVGGADANESPEVRDFDYLSLDYLLLQREEGQDFEPDSVISRPVPGYDLPYLVNVDLGDEHEISVVWVDGAFILQLEQVQCDLLKWGPKLVRGDADYILKID